MADKPGTSGWVKGVNEKYQSFMEDPRLSRKSVKNETIRANNKRMDRDEPFSNLKRVPVGAAGAKEWKPAKKTTRKRVTTK
jgi:hypothetical protein